LPVLLKADAFSLGQNCRIEIADNTLCLVTLDTFVRSLMTRDTVAVETPAIRATSFTVDANSLTPGEWICATSCSNLDWPRLTICQQQKPIILNRLSDRCSGSHRRFVDFLNANLLGPPNELNIEPFVRSPVGIQKPGLIVPTAEAEVSSQQ
jgi:hypothetical protein